MSRNSRPSLRTFAIIGSIAVGIWLVVLTFGWSQAGLPSQAPLANLGLFGDMFGSINALFSALAMSGAIYAIILQQWQIQDQKQHDYDMLRREKLEAIVFKLENLSVKSAMVGGHLSRSFKAPFDPPDAEATAILTSAVIQYNEIRALIYLYFPSHVSELLPPSFNAAFTDSLTRANENKTTVPNDAITLKYLNELMAITMNYIAGCSKCVERAAESIQRFIDSP